MTRYGHGVPCARIEIVEAAHPVPDAAGRAAAPGISARTSLADDDGHGFFEALGDQPIAGPILTNVNDFRAVLIAPEGSASSTG